MVAGIETDLENLIINLIQQPLELRFEVDETACVGVDAYRQSVFFHTYTSHGRQPVAEGRPFRPFHLFGLAGPPSSWCAAGRDGIDQNQMLRAVRNKRLAGALRSVQHILPSLWIVKRAEQDTANQGKVMPTGCHF